MRSEIHHQKYFTFCRQNLKHLHSSVLRQEDTTSDYPQKYASPFHQDFSNTVFLHQTPY